MHHHRRVKYKNLLLLGVSLVVAVWLSRIQGFHEFLLGMGAWGYVGAFLGGMLFVSTFTVATGAVVLLVLAERLSMIEVGIVAGMGAVVGDFAIFRFVKDDLVREIESIYDLFDGDHHLLKLLHSKYFSWSLPVVGAAIIASPLPDEIGVSLMGISKMKSAEFLVLSFVLNTLGILGVVLVSTVVKP